MIDHESARASLERQLRRANPGADVRVKRMRRCGQEMLLVSAPERIIVPLRWQSYPVEFRKLNTAALIPGTPQYDTRAANLKRNARLRRLNGPRAEVVEDVDFIYEDGE
jgi:hypothetical protein